MSTTLDLVHHLLDINGVAELLGMTRQGAYKLVERDPTFPAPEAIVTAGRIWSTAAVEEWMLVPGHRRVVNYRDGGELLRFRVVVELRDAAVIIPAADVVARSPLGWARTVGRFGPADRLNPERFYVPLQEWEARVAVDGSSRNTP
jgi:predicted DNA-binding transcriptional regulator AlpA